MDNSKPSILQLLDRADPQAHALETALPGLVAALNDAGLASAIHFLDASHDLRSRIASAQLVHIHGWATPATRRAAALARRLKRPYIISPCGELTPSSRERRGLLAALRRGLRNRPAGGAVTIAAVNATEETELRRVLPKSQVTLLPYGMSFDALDKTIESPAQAFDPPAGTLNAPANTTQRRNPNARNLLMLGSLHPADGCALLLKSLAEMGPETDGWGLTFASQDNDRWRGTLEAAIQRKGAADRVRFLSMQGADTAEMLAQATIFVAPGFRVRCPATILQALAAGVPVVCTKPTSPPNLENAIALCEPNRESLKQTLRPILAMSDEERSAKATRASEKARALYTWTSLAPRYADFYRQRL
jgi:glycosyltransferase involved in cell wall biosynthesis